MGCGYLQPPKSFSFSIIKRKCCQTQTLDSTRHRNDTLNDYWEPALLLCCLGKDYNPKFLESLDKENSIGRNLDSHGPFLFLVGREKSFQNKRALTWLCQPPQSVPRVA